ncbi:TPA: hypothetical protein REU56_002930, partial [Listeria monocytogenes]|nr:hypothetical protein [Listeria monocytogenes]
MKSKQGAELKAGRKVVQKLGGETKKSGPMDYLKNPEHNGEHHYFKLDGKEYYATRQHENEDYSVRQVKSRGERNEPFFGNRIEGKEKESLLERASLKGQKVDHKAKKEEKTKRKLSVPKEQLKSLKNPKEKEYTTASKEDGEVMWSDGQQYFVTRPDKNSMYSVHKVEGTNEDGSLKLGKELDQKDKHAIDTVLKRAGRHDLADEHERVKHKKTPEEERDKKIE